MKNSLLVLLFLWMTACRPSSEQPVLNDGQMARVMADLYIAEAATNGLSGYAKDSLTNAYYRQVLEMHGIALADYEKSLRIMATDLPRLKAINEQAAALLESGKKAGAPAEKSGETPK